MTDNPMSGMAQCKMWGANALLLLCLIICSGCSVNLQKEEEYRRIIGSTSMGLLLATLHADELIITKINSSTVTERDRERVAGLLESLKRHETQVYKMLHQMYNREDFQKRDQAILPIIHEMVLATDALNKYLVDKDEKELKEYFAHRGKFMESVEELKQKYGIGQSEKKRP